MENMEKFNSDEFKKNSQASEKGSVNSFIFIFTADKGQNLMSEKLSVPQFFSFKFQKNL